MTTVYRSFEVAHLDTLKHVIKAGGNMPLSIMFDHRTADRVPFNVVGYSSNRWIKYTDAYLFGGRPFLDFLARPVPANSAATFTFGGKSNHKRGPCLLSLTVTRELVHVNARVLHWANAAVLDLSLLWLLLRHYKRDVWLTCPRVSVLDWQLAGYRHLDQLKIKSPLIDNARRFRKHPEKLHWDRMQKKARRTFDHDNTDEENVISNFPRVTPEDLAKHLNVKGVKMRDVLRKHFGYSTKGSDRMSHSWSSFDDPRCIKLLQALGVDRRKLPTIDALVVKRL